MSWPKTTTFKKEILRPKFKSTTFQSKKKSIYFLLYYCSLSFSCKQWGKSVVWALSRNVLNVCDVLFKGASSPFPWCNVMFLLTCGPLRVLQQTTASDSFKVHLELFLYPYMSRVEAANTTSVHDTTEVNYNERTKRKQKRIQHKYLKYNYSNQISSITRYNLWSMS